MKAKKIKRKELSHASGPVKVHHKKNIQAVYPKWMPMLLVAITFLALLPVLKADFVNWDDNDYVLDNILIRDLSNLDKILFSPLQGNYHPLTVLSLAFNYAISGLEPWSYHLLNLLIHILNVFLVFKLIFKLTKGNNLIAFVTAILFGIHPMHVESVAWASERKDVLYAFFFLSGLITWLKYLDNKKQGWYAATLAMALFSMLSKPAAIIFPLALIFTTFIFCCFFA